MISSLSSALVLCFASVAAAAYQSPLLVGGAPRGVLARPARAAVSLDFGGPRYKEDAQAGEVAEVPFEIRFSLGNLVSASGLLLLVYCLGSYLLNNGQGDIIATFGFVYAIPALVGGLALKYAELPPVPVTTSPEAEKAREAKATTIQAKIFSDATRFTYGDAHMEDPLKALKLAPRGMGPPELKSIREFVSPQGGYGLGLTFFAPNTPYRVWKVSVRRAAPVIRILHSSIQFRLQLGRKLHLVGTSHQDTARS